MMFMHVDVNAFYASCETVFRPDLQGKAIIVLSNNDGCVIARNQQAKQLGIMMGVPYFKISPHVIQQQDIVVFSSNYPLYADMSARVMDTLALHSDEMEIYSIDEAFLTINQQKSYTEFGHYLRQIVKQQTHLTVGVGIAPTKTLAKLANYAAKNYPQCHGVVDLSCTSRQKRLMAMTPINEVWGVGRHLSDQLTKAGIKTAIELANMSPLSVRKKFNIVLERTVRELQGEPCLQLDAIADTKQQIVCSRSFGEKVTQYEIMRQALCHFTVRAAEKLRLERQYCQHLTVFIKTSPFAPNTPFFSRYLSDSFTATNDTSKLLTITQKILDKLWCDNQLYQKAGIILNDFCDLKVTQLNLFEDEKMKRKREQLMQLVDNINQLGKGKIQFAAQGFTTQWQMKQAHLSPCYTTRVKDIACAKLT